MRDHASLHHKDSGKKCQGMIGHVGFASQYLNPRIGSEISCKGHAIMFCPVRGASKWLEDHLALLPVSCPPGHLGVKNIVNL